MMMTTTETKEEHVYPPYRKYFNIRDCFYCEFPDRFDKYEKEGKAIVKHLRYDRKWEDAREIYFEDISHEKERKLAGWTRPPRRAIQPKKEEPEKPIDDDDGTLLCDYALITLLFFCIVVSLKTFISS